MAIIFTKKFQKLKLVQNSFLPEPGNPKDRHATGSINCFESSGTASLATLVLAEGSALDNGPSGF